MKAAFAAACIYLAMASFAFADKIVRKDGSELVGQIVKEDGIAVTMRVVRGSLSMTTVIRRDEISAVEHAPLPTASTQPAASAASPTTHPAEPLSVSVDRMKKIRAEAYAREKAQYDQRTSIRDDYVQKHGARHAELVAKLDALRSEFKTAAASADLLQSQYDGEIARANREFERDRQQAVHNNGARDRLMEERANREHESAVREVDGRYQPQVQAIATKLVAAKSAIDAVAGELKSIEAGTPPVPPIRPTINQ